MKNRILIVVALMVTIVLIPGWVPAQEENNDKLMPNPLAPFERLIGGRWYLEGSYQMDFDRRWVEPTQGASEFEVVLVDDGAPACRSIHGQENLIADRSQCKILLVVI